MLDPTLITITSNTTVTLFLASGWKFEVTKQPFYHYQVNKAAFLPPPVIYKEEEKANNILVRDIFPKVHWKTNQD